jgi:hypothetical protein
MISSSSSSSSSSNGSNNTDTNNNNCNSNNTAYFRTLIILWILPLLLMWQAVHLTSNLTFSGANENSSLLGCYTVWKQCSAPKRRYLFIGRQDIPSQKKRISAFIRSYILNFTDILFTFKFGSTSFINYEQHTHTRVSVRIICYVTRLMFLYICETEQNASHQSYRGTMKSTFQA